MNKMYISKEDLDNNPEWIFVFGDNLARKGYGGAAKLRDHPQSYGFITKKYPGHKDSDFYTIEEYKAVFKEEYSKLIKLIESNPTKSFFITKIGSGLANRFRIFENIIKDELLELYNKYDNVFIQV